MLVLSFALKYSAKKDTYWVSFGNSKKDAKSGKWYDGAWFKKDQAKAATSFIVGAYRNQYITTVDVGEVTQEEGPVFGMTVQEAEKELAAAKESLKSLNKKIKETDEDKCVDMMCEQAHDEMCYIAELEAELKAV